MFRPLWIAGIVCCACASGVAATATFSPSVADVEPGVPAAFELFLAPETLDAFDAADVLIGSDQVADISFSYSDQWLQAMDGSVSPITYDIGPYSQAAYAGGFRESGPVQEAVHLGTLLIDTTGLPAGDYAISVDGMFDGLSRLTLAGESEPITGVGIVRIPEPASLALLAAGLLLTAARPR